ncbi:MAG: Type 1 glutamine amidotransferase-like domain-containing protein [bacterium]|nr:Type 1 glutamine amidotransferase-like domain-containing protein [bacterium]
MKLLLTSDAFSTPAINQAFIGLLPKGAAGSSVLVVHSPAKNEYIKNSIAQLGDLGLHVTAIDLDHLDNAPILNVFDAIYICGGNTYEYLEKIRASTFDKTIQQFVSAGGIYVGVSAGSIIAGPTIDVAGIGALPDDNAFDLKNTLGLHLTDYIISPHYTEDEEPHVQKFESHSLMKVTRLRDGQALLVKDDDTAELI